MSSTNFWKVLTRLKKRYINLSPISDQISPAFEGQTTSGEVKKIFWKWQFFWQMRWHRNFLVLYSSTAGMYYLNFVRKKWYIFIPSRRTIGVFKIVRNIVSELRYCPDLKMIWWNFKVLYDYRRHVPVYQNKSFFYQGTWSRPSQTWMGRGASIKMKIKFSNQNYLAFYIQKNLEIFFFITENYLKITLGQTHLH